MTTVNISVGNACNLRCNFCYNDGGREKKTFFKTYEQIVENMNEIYEDGMSLIFIGGEPTMHPKFIDVLIKAKEIGYTNIFIATNLIKFYNLSYLKKILGLGILKGIIASVHSNSDLIEDKITGRKGIFQKKELALKNIDKFNKSSKINKVNIYINFVINNDNYLFTSDIVKRMLEIGVTEIRFYTMMLFNNFTKKNLDSLPRYSDFIPIINTLDDEILKISSIHWAPLCISLRVKLGKIRELDRDYIKNLNNDGIKLFDNHIASKEKVKECNDCYAYGKFCFGVYKGYLEKFGKGEFSKVTRDMIVNRIKKI